MLAAPHLVAAAPFDAPHLAFLGLGRTAPQTNDYVPLFPWFGLVLAGVALARYGLPAFTRSGAGTWRAEGRLARGLAFAGRHSLAIYLIHQPVLMALFTGLVTLTGPHPQAGVAEFRALYVPIAWARGGRPRPARGGGLRLRCLPARESLGGRTAQLHTGGASAGASALAGLLQAAEGTTPAP